MATPCPPLEPGQQTDSLSKLASRMMPSVAPRDSDDATTMLRSTPLRRLFVLLEDLGSAQATRAAGGNETDLLSVRGPPRHRGRVTDVLVVASSVGVLHRVHGNSTHLQAR